MEPPERTRGMEGHQQGHRPQQQQLEPQQQHDNCSPRHARAREVSDCRVPRNHDKLQQEEMDAIRNDRGRYDMFVVKNSSKSFSRPSSLWTSQPLRRISIARLVVVSIVAVVLFLSRNVACLTTTSRARKLTVGSKGDEYLWMLPERRGQDDMSYFFARNSRLWSSNTHRISRRVGRGSSFSVMRDTALRHGRRSGANGGELSDSNDSNNFRIPTLYHLLDSKFNSLKLRRTRSSRSALSQSSSSGSSTNLPDFVSKQPPTVKPRSITQTSLDDDPVEEKSAASSPMVDSKTEQVLETARKTWADHILKQQEQQPTVVSNYHPSTNSINNNVIMSNNNNMNNNKKSVDTRNTTAVVTEIIEKAKAKMMAPPPSWDESLFMENENSMNSASNSIYSDATFSTSSQDYSGGMDSAGNGKSSVWNGGESSLDGTRSDMQSLSSNPFTKTSAAIATAKDVAAGRESTAHLLETAAHLMSSPLPTPVGYSKPKSSKANLPPTYVPQPRGLNRSNGAHNGSTMNDKQQKNTKGNTYHTHAVGKSSVKILVDHIKLNGGGTAGSNLKNSHGGNGMGLSMLPSTANSTGDQPSRDGSVKLAPKRGRDSLERFADDLTRVLQELRPNTFDPTLPSLFRNTPLPSFVRIWTTADWDRHSRRMRYWDYIRFFPNSRLLRRILPPLSILVAWSAAVAWFFTSSWTPRFFTSALKQKMSLPLMPLSLVSSFVAALLTLRSNQGLNRLNEGRVALGKVVLYTREAAQLIANSIYTKDTELGLKLGRHLALFGWLLKNFVRGGGHHKLLGNNHSNGDEDIVRAVLGSVDRADATYVLAQQRKLPIAVITRIRQVVHFMAERDMLSTAEELALDHTIQALNGCITTCERIRNSPIPPLYTHHCGRLLIFYLFGLPLALTGTFPNSPWAVVLTTTVLGFTMLGLDEISHLLEEPFKYMPLYQLCRNSMKDVGDAFYCQPPSLLLPAIAEDDEDGSGGISDDEGKKVYKTVTGSTVTLTSLVSSMSQQSKNSHKRPPYWDRTEEVL